MKSSNPTWTNTLDTRTYVSLLYISYYGRPGDAEGIDYWVARIDTDGADISGVVDAFAASEEATELYGGQSAGQLITSLYRDLLNREPDPTGFAFYVDILTTKSLSLADLMNHFHDGMGVGDTFLVEYKLGAAGYFLTVLADAEQVYDQMHVTFAKSWLNSITLNNLDEIKAALDDAMAPVFSSGDSVTVMENAVVSTVIYDAEVGGDKDILYALDDLSTFTIDANTGEVTFNEPPDYETIQSYTFEVSATNSMGHTITDTVTVTVSDADEIAPVFISNGKGSVAENSPRFTVVYDAQARDNGGETDSNITYSIAGMDAADFIINADTGEVALNNSMDYETHNTYTLEVTATDNNGNATAQTLVVSITDVDEIAPVFLSGNYEQVVENLPRWNPVYDAQAADSSGEIDVGITYTLPVLVWDNNLFTITPEGVVYFINSPDYEKPFGTDNNYTILVEASDEYGNSSHQTVNVKVTDDIYDNPPGGGGDVPYVDPIGTLQYDWDSSQNALTVIGTDGDGIKEIRITDSDGVEIQKQIINAQTGEMVLDLEDAYNGADNNFEEIPGFEGDEYNAYRSILPFTFTIEDNNGNITEETFRVIINKGINLYTSVHSDNNANKGGFGPVNPDAGEAITSPDDRDMILQGVRDVLSITGINSFNRDIYLKENTLLDENGVVIAGDHVYLEKQTEAGKTGWVDDKASWTSVALGAHIVGQVGNESGLSFNTGSLGSYRVVMEHPAVELNELATLKFFDVDGDFKGFITAINYYTISLGANAPDVSVLMGNDHDNLIESYDGAYLGYGLGGNDTFRGGPGNEDNTSLLGNSWLDGGNGIDLLNLRYDVSKDTHIEMDMGTQYLESQVDDEGGWFRTATVKDSDGTVLSYDYFRNIERIIGAATDDILIGNADDNEIHGGEKNGWDEIWGVSGTNLLIGGGGDDEIYGGDGDDTIYGGHYGSWEGSNSESALAGVDGVDYIEGGEGNDTIYGQDGNDWIEGGDGDDVMVGGAGDDYIIGGDGADAYVFNEITEGIDEFEFVISDDSIHFEAANFGIIDAMVYQEGASFDNLSDGNMLVAYTTEYANIDAAAAAIAANPNITATHGFFLVIEDGLSDSPTLIYSDDLAGDGEEWEIGWVDIDNETVADFSAANFVFF